MIGGAIMTAIATILFGFTRPVAGMFSEEGSDLVRAHLQSVAVVLMHIQYNSLAIWLAVFAIYVMDFSINAGMCYLNSLCIPSPEVSLCNMQSRLLIELWSLTCYQLVCKPPEMHGLPLCLALAVLLVSSCWSLITSYMAASQIMNRRGNIDLPHLFPWLGGTQLEVLVILTSFFLLSTHAVTAWCVKEEVFTDP